MAAGMVIENANDLHVSTHARQPTERGNRQAGRRVDMFPICVPDPAASMNAAYGAIRLVHSIRRGTSQVRIDHVLYLQFLVSLRSYNVGDLSDGSSAHRTESYGKLRSASRHRLSVSDRLRFDPLPQGSDLRLVWFPTWFSNSVQTLNPRLSRYRK